MSNTCWSDRGYFSGLYGHFFVVFLRKTTLEPRLIWSRLAVQNFVDRIIQTIHFYLLGPLFLSSQKHLILHDLEKSSLEKNPGPFCCHKNTSFCMTCPVFGIRSCKMRCFCDKKAAQVGKSVLFGWVCLRNFAQLVLIIWGEVSKWFYAKNKTKKWPYKPEK